MTEKFCKRCSTTKALTEFYKKASAPDGLRSECKACDKARAKAWYGENLDLCLERGKAAAKKWRTENREKKRATNRAWYAKNPEKSLASSAKWRANNKERADETRKAWYRANKARIRAVQYAWRAANPERFAATNKRARENNPASFKASKERWLEKNPEARRVWEARRRARKHAAGGRHTAEDIKALFKLQRGCCAVCRARMARYHVDHIQPLASGGSNDPDNLQLLCPKCNGSKHAKDPILFMQERGFLL